MLTFERMWYFSILQKNALLTQPALPITLSNVLYILCNKQCISFLSFQIPKQVFLLFEPIRKLREKDNGNRFQFRLCKEYHVEAIFHSKFCNCRSGEILPYGQQEKPFIQGSLQNKYGKLESDLFLYVLAQRLREGVVGLWYLKSTRSRRTVLGGPDTSRAQPHCQE